MEKVDIEEEFSKQKVYEFWNDKSCGEAILLRGEDLGSYLEQSRKRYELEPYIIDFADFKGARGKKVLEIGVGLGADHQNFAENGAILYGIDLTERAIAHCGTRLKYMGLSSTLKVGDAENLDFPDNYFDIVYSWGVIHHSPDTAKIAKEILRVLKPGGKFKVMVYHKHSLIGWMLWVRYALMRGRLGMSLDEIYATYLESPGTKAYTQEEARALFEGASLVESTTVLTHGDLLEGQAGQRHEGILLSIARKIWPRPLFKLFFKNNGLFLLLSGIK